MPRSRRTSLEARVDLAKSQKAREAQGQRLPALFPLPAEILRKHRLRSINAALSVRVNLYGYNGDYSRAYPIKVNQARRVIESLIHSGEPLGPEAGSKSGIDGGAGAWHDRSVILRLYGYKDREYIRLALIGEKMGHKVYLVIEKMSEIAIVLKKLSAQRGSSSGRACASGLSVRWRQLSGGEKSYRRRPRCCNWWIPRV